MYALGALIVIGFFVLMGMLIYVTVPEGNKDVINIVIGALIGAFTSVVGYFFGSSLGSARKDEQMKEMQAKVVATGSPLAPVA